MAQAFYFQEEQEYTPAEVAEILDVEKTAAMDICANLVHSSLAVYVNKKNNEWQESERIIIKYVGLAEIQGFLLRFYPKYIKRTPEIQDIKLVLGAIERYRDKHLTELNSENNVLTYMPHRLEQALALLRDYLSNGLYFNQNEKILIHGNAEIDWDLTINTTCPVIQNNKPYYFDYYTREMRQDDTDFYTRLHACILTECSRYLHEWELDEILDIPLAYLYQGTRETLGADDYLRRRLLQERNVQYNSRKQELLHNIIAWIDNSPYEKETGGLRLFGTMHFHSIWEQMCRDVFDDQRHNPLDELDLTLHEEYKIKRKQELLSIIPHPQWYAYGDKKTIKHSVDETLEPDFLKVTWLKDGSAYLVIFDAKYYDLILSPDELSGQPGIGDINKQFLYEMSYSDFRKKHKLKSLNAFLFPTDREDNAVIGYVCMPLFSGKCKVVLISGTWLMSAYINSKHYVLSDTKVIPELFS